MLAWSFTSNCGIMNPEHLHQFLRQLRRYYGSLYVYVYVQKQIARMAELVYAFDLKSNGEIHMGSSPISGTNHTV